MERVLHVARSPADIRTAPVSVPVPISLRTERNTPLEARRIRKRDRARRRTRRDLRTHHSRRRAMVAAGDVPSAAAAPPNRSRSQCGIQQPRVPALKSNRRAHRNSRALRARDTRRTAVHRRASSVKNCEAHWRAHWTGAHWTGKPRSQFCRGAVPVLNWCPSTGAHWGAHWTGAHWTGKPRSQFCRGDVPVLNWCPSSGLDWTIGRRPGLRLLNRHGLVQLDFVHAGHRW